MKLQTLQPLVVAAALVAALATVPAHAEGLYLGGALGVPHFGDTINGVSGKGSGMSGKLFGGYQLTPNFAIEAGVADLGHISSASGTLQGRGEYLDAVGLILLDNKWSLLGSLGLAHVNLDTSNGDGSGNGLKLGLGAQYALASNVALRGEWERYHPSAFGDKPNIDQFTLGVRVGF